MQYVGKILSDIFQMSFDIIIPLSGCIIAMLIALLLFLIRYISFKRNKRKYEKQHAGELSVPAEEPLEAAPATAAPLQKAAHAMNAVAVWAPAQPEFAYKVDVRDKDERPAGAVLEAAKQCDDMVMGILMKSIECSNAELAKDDRQITGMFGAEMKRSVLDKEAKASR